MSTEVIEITSNEESTLLVPRYKKVEKKAEKKSRSDLGLLVSYNPEKALKIRVPARFWDDESRYPAEAGGTPLNYVDTNLTTVVSHMVEDNDDINIAPFYKLKDFNKKSLLAIETSVEPINKTKVVYEAIDFLMNDEKSGMGCDYHPVLRANVHINKEKFNKSNELIPLNLSEFYGIITYTGNCTKPIIQYDWKDIPYNVKARNIKKANKCIDVKRMRGGNTGFYFPIEFRDSFTIISFNKVKENYEFHVLEGFADGSVKRYHYDANSNDLVSAIEELSICFFDRWKKEEVRAAIAALESSTEEVFRLTETGFVNTDLVYVSDDEAQEQEETCPISDIVSNEDEEEPEFC